MNISRSLVGVAVVALLLASACSSGTTSQVLGEGRGELVIEIHDHPAPAIVECWITIASAEAHHMGSDWIHIAGDYPHTFDLRTMVNGRTKMLGSDAVPEGDYDRLRIHMTGARLVLQDGAEVHVQMPQGGIHTEVPIAQRCRVGAGRGATVSIDFLIDGSFRHNGDESWTCDPQINVDGVREHEHHH